MSFRRVRTVVKSDYYLRHVRSSVRPSVRPHTWNSAPAGRTFPKFCTDEIYKIVWRIHGWLIPTKIKGISHTDLHNMCLYKYFGHSVTMLPSIVIDNDCNRHPHVIYTMHNSSSSSSVICQTTGTKPLPKRFLHIARSRASSFN